jgi:hypothetical protein
MDDIGLGMAPPLPRCRVRWTVDDMGCTPAPLRAIALTVMRTDGCVRMMVVPG